MLLDLIEKQKLDVTSLSIAKVADDFLDFIENEKSIDLGGLSEFLAVASQLILLKSKALLPLFEFTKEEEEEIENLEERLKEYGKFKEISEKINAQYANSNISFSKDEENFTPLRKFVPPEITAKEIFEIFASILQEVPTEDLLEEQFMEEIVSLEDKMCQLRATIESRVQIAFHETIRQAENKIEIVITFLAMLEMIKQKIITVKQSGLFGEIMIQKKIILSKQKDA